MDQCEAAIVTGRKLSEAVGEGGRVSQGSNGRIKQEFGRKHQTGDSQLRQKKCPQKPDSDKNSAVLCCRLSKLIQYTEKGLCVCICPYLLVYAVSERFG